MSKKKSGFWVTERGSDGKVKTEFQEIPRGPRIVAKIISDIIDTFRGIKR